MAICKLYEQAKARNFVTYTQQFESIYKTVKKAITATEKQVNETLQTDETIFNHFDPFTCYSLEAILILIPKLNNVTCTEWESFKDVQLPYYRSIQAKCESFSKHVHLNVHLRSLTLCKPVPDKQDVQIIQRKITPWKTLLEEKTTTKKLGDFIVIASLVDKMANLGGLSRTCEIFGVKQLIVDDIRAANDKEFKSLSMSSECWLEFVEIKAPEISDFLVRIKSEGYTVIAAEQTSESVTLQAFKFPVKTVLLLG